MKLDFDVSNLTVPVRAQAEQIRKTTQCGINLLATAVAYFERTLMEFRNRLVHNRER
jgi:hypothetical protein